MNNMNYIYEQLERCKQTIKINKFNIFVEGDIKEVYENEHLIARINMDTKTFYTEYKLKADVFFFTRFLKNLNYKLVKSPVELQCIPKECINEYFVIREKELNII